MNHLNPGAARGAWKSNESPTHVGGRMETLGDMGDTLRHPIRRPAKRDEFNRLTERQNGADERRGVAADSGRRRLKRTAIDADTERCYRISM
jgi:hypothetical protein